MKYKYPIKTIPDEERRLLRRSNCNNGSHLNLFCQNVFCWYKKYSSISKVYEHVIQVSKQILNHLSVLIIDKALALLVYTQAGLFFINVSIRVNQYVQSPLSKQLPSYLQTTRMFIRLTSPHPTLLIKIRVVHKHMQ